jgi:hypothetical protein
MENMYLRNRFLQLTLVVLSLAIGMHAQDRATCSNATLHGSYGLHATGTTASGEFAAVGHFTYDGKGKLTGKLFARVAGENVEPPEFSGTYSVSPDCMMTDTFGPPINSTHVSVIVDNGREYFILDTTSGSGHTVSGVARKQHVGILR